MSSRKRNLAIGLGVVSLAGIAGSAFANTLGSVPATNAGQGVTVTSGYTVADVRFTSNAAAANSNAANLQTIAFTLSLGQGGVVPTTGHTVLARVNSGGNWVACTVAAAGATSCTLATANITAVTAVEIVAFRST